MSPDLERLIGRAVLNKAFRDQLLVDPDGAIKVAGFTLLPQEMDNLKRQNLKKRYTPEQFNQELTAVTRTRW